LLKESVLKAAVFLGPGNIRIEDRAEPRIEENEILMRIKATSVCGTDLRISKFGHFKIPQGERRVLGHELAGEIVQVGSSVKGYSEGMRITVSPNIGCGLCQFCREGYNQMCPDYEAFGISLDGGFEEFMKVPSIAIRGGNIFPIPDHISFEEASLIEPLSCCYNAFKVLKTSSADEVLVIGAGPIGALHVQLSRIAGAKQIMVADIRKERLDKIKEFGADVMIDTGTKDLKTEVMRATGGRGADVIITACSVPEIQSQSIELLATHGRVNFFGGLGQNVQVPLDTNSIHYKGLHLMGTTGSSNSDYFNALSLVAGGRANLRKIISATFSLADITKAFEHAASGDGLKALITN
jgi:threonine dehydrogenase-like Zn-dependent dehydrogenase